MSDSSVQDSPETPGAEAEAPEPEAVETVAEETSPEQPEGDTPTEAPAETPPEPDKLTPLQKELEELRAERARLLPLAEFAQRALQERQRQQTPTTDPQDRLVDEGFRLLWEGPASQSEEAVQEHQAAFKALPVEARRAAAERFRAAQQSEVERVRDPAAWAMKHLAPLVRQAVREEVGPVVAKNGLAEFNAEFPDLANDEGYTAVLRLTQEGMSVKRAAQFVRLERAAAERAGEQKSKAAAAADSRAVLEARRGKASAKPERVGGAKSIKRSGFSYEDAVRDVEEASRGE